MKRASLLAALAFVLPVHVADAAKPKIVCKRTSIRMTVSADGKGYVLTSAIVCSNGKIALRGKQK